MIESGLILCHSSPLWSSVGPCESVGGCLCVCSMWNLKWQVADKLKTLSASEMQCPEAFIPPRTPLLNEYSPLPPRYARQSPANTCLPVAPPLPRSTVHAFCLFVIFITLRQATSPFKKLPRCSLFLTPRTAHLSDSSGMYCHSEKHKYSLLFICLQHCANGGNFYTVSL